MHVHPACRRTHNDIYAYRIEHVASGEVYQQYIV